MAMIRKNYESSVAEGKLSQKAYAKMMSLITLPTSYDGLDTVDIVAPGGPRSPSSAG